MAAAARSCCCSSRIAGASFVRFPSSSRASSCWFRCKATSAALAQQRAISSTTIQLSSLLSNRRSNHSIPSLVAVNQVAIKGRHRAGSKVGCAGCGVQVNFVAAAPTESSSSFKQTTPQQIIITTFLIEVQLCGCFQNCISL
jgi:hypothetical protein